MTKILLRIAFAIALIHALPSAAWATKCSFYGNTYECVDPEIGAQRYEGYFSTIFASGWQTSAGAAFSNLTSRISQTFSYCQVGFGGVQNLPLDPPFGPNGKAIYAGSQPVTILCPNWSTPDTINITVYGWADASCPAGSLPDISTGNLVCLSPYNSKPPKKIAVDPGHGLSCGARGLLVGAIGATEFAASDPPPGKLVEDVLTLAISREIRRALPEKKYKVYLTKNDLNSCPTYVDRGQLAVQKNAELFVSVHINARSYFPGTSIPNPTSIGSGTSVLYNGVRVVRVGPLADEMSRRVAYSLGVNARGGFIRNDLGVLNPSVTPMPSVILETARLGYDEQVLHRPQMPSRVAGALESTLDWYFGY